MGDDRAGVLSQSLAARRFEITRPYLRGSVLDVGCHEGRLADMCQPDAYLGLDLHEPSLEVARREHPGFRFTSTFPQDERFDTIVALAVIEHVDQPGVMLKQFADVLAPGGRAVLTTPHPRMEWVHTAGARVGLFSQHAHDDHEDLLDLPAMRTLAAGAGLAVQKYQRFMLGANQLFVLSAAAGPAGPGPGT